MEIYKSWNRTPANIISDVYTKIGRMEERIQKISGALNFLEARGADSHRQVQIV